jgi:hypothetical protein
MRFCVRDLSLSLRIEKAYGGNNDAPLKWVEHVAGLARVWEPPETQSAPKSGDSGYDSLSSLATARTSPGLRLFLFCDFFFVLFRWRHSRLLQLSRQFGKQHFEYVVVVCTQATGIR